MTHLLTLPVKPIKNNLTFFIFMFVLGLTSILFIPFSARKPSVFELFADLYTLCICLSFLPSGMSRYLSSVLSVVFYSLALIDMACYVRIGSPITPLLLQLFSQSNIQETAEVLSAYLSPSMFLSPLGIILLLMVCHITVALKPEIIGMIGKKKVPYPHIWGIVVGSIYIVALIQGLPNKEYCYRRVVLQWSELEVQQHKDLSPRTKFYLPVYRLAFAYAEYNRLERIIEELANYNRQTTIDTCCYTSPHVVLIIGESCNKSHFSLYGYDKGTTPFQKKRESAGELVKFSDVISSWNVTCESWQNMLSTWGVGDSGDWYQHPFFTEIFKKAGYHVSLFSNQYVQNAAMSFSSFIEDIFINEPNISQLQFDSRNTQIHPYDMGLICEYRVMKQSFRHTLTLFHFMGVHADFSQRYPKEWNRFKASDYRRKDLTYAEKTIMAQYDNAILYNDFVIEHIIREFEEKEAIVIFVPDHGERVFDTGKEWGRSLTWQKGDIRAQFEIPFWIWGSKSYREKHPQIWTSILTACHQPYMTDLLAHLLFYLGGIECSAYKEVYNLLSPYYKANRKRIIRNEKDYDSLMMSQNHSR